MIKHSWHIWCMLLLATGHSLAAAPLARYRYARPIDGSFAEQEMVAVPFNETIWQAIGTEDVDIRIADHDGNPVPHLIRKAGTRATRTVRHRRPSRIETLSDHEEGQLELRVVLTDKDTPGANVVDFDTPLRNFEKTVTVWGLGEDETETLLAERKRIFDYRRFADVRNTAINLPEESIQFRALRILIEDVFDEETLPLRWETRRFEAEEETLREEHRRILTRPFRMNAVRLYERQTEDAGSVPRIEQEPFLSTTLRREQDPAKTIIEAEHTGAPLTAIVLVCDDTNFSRQAIVEIPVRRDGREAWREIAAKQVSRISFRDTQHTALQIPFPETRSRRYRVTLLDHDNPPLQDLSLMPKGPVSQAVFLANPKTEYALYYGVEGTPHPPRYDLSPLQRLLRQDHEPIVLSLQAETDNPHFQKASLFAGENAMRILFALAIIIMLAILAAALYRASRHIP